MKYTTDELKAICEKHIKWLRNESGGERADLSGANLSGADLYGANLYGANLSRANLYGANLSRANLSGADLYGANLYGANLSGANLYGANLSRADLSRADLSRADLPGANLSGANLYGANLYGANLSGANLSGANLSRANLPGANLSGANLSRADLSGANLSGADLYGAKNADYAAALTMVPSEGPIIGWKKAHSSKGDCIVKLRIPEAAKRSSATGRKCRAEYAEVVEVIGAECALSDHRDANGAQLEYRAGITVRPDKWDDNRWEECSNGIHFFITRAEAEQYSL